MYYTEKIIKEIIEEISYYINTVGNLELSDKCTIIPFHKRPITTSADMKGNGFNLETILKKFINNEEDIDMESLTSKENRDLFRETIRCIKDYYETPGEYFL